MFARLFGSTEKPPEFTPRLVRSIVDHNGGPVCALQTLPDGRLVSTDGGGTIAVRETTTGRRDIQFLYDAEGNINPKSNKATSLQVLPNGRVVSGWLDGTIRICDSTRWFYPNSQVSTLWGCTSSVMVLQGLPDGRLASGSYDGTIRIWDTKTTLSKTTLCLATLTGHSGPVYALQILPDGRLVSGSYDGTIRIWDTTKGKCLATLSGHNKRINALQVLPNGFLVSASEDGTISIWEVSLRQVFLTQQAVSDASINTVSTSSVKSVSHTQEKESLKSAAIQSVLSNTTTAIAAPSAQLILTQSNFEALTLQIETRKARPPISETSLSEELQLLQQRIQEMNTQAQPTFSPEEAQSLQARILADKKQEALLIERQAIFMNPNQRAYYEALQTHISELMVASLGVGSGYVSVNTSQATQVVGWICEAISSVFPAAALATAVIHSGVSYLDKQYRQDFLTKVRVLGTTLTEAEALGEQVARLLVRAHYHAEQPLSSQKAAEDAKAMIMAIVKAKPVIVRNDNTPHQLVQAIWGGASYCKEPLPSQPVPPVSATNMLLDSDEMVESGVAVSVVPLNTLLDFEHVVEASVSISMNTTSASSATTVEDLLCQLAEERAQRIKAQEDIARLQEHIEKTALKSEVASKKEMTSLKMDVAKLQGTSSEGGQMLINREIPHDKDSETQIQSERRYAHMESHIEYVSSETLELIERNARNEARIAELEKLLFSTKSLPTTGIFAYTSLTQNRVPEAVELQLEHMSQAEKERLKESKTTLFSV